MKARTSGEPPAGNEPRSPALRRLLFSVGAWITAATATAIGNLGINATDSNPAVAWLFSQLAPGLLVLLSIGLVFSVASGAVRLRAYRRQQAASEIDPVGPPPPTRSDWHAEDELVRQLLEDPNLRIDKDRVHRIDVRGVTSDTVWWDAADRILMMLDLPGPGPDAGKDDRRVQDEIAGRCARALGEHALLVLDQEERHPERTAWLARTFTDLSRGVTEAVGPGPYLRVVGHTDRSEQDLDRPRLVPSSPGDLLLQAFARLSIDELDTDGLIALSNDLAVFIQTTVSSDAGRSGYSPATAIAAAGSRTQVSAETGGRRFVLSTPMRDELRRRWTSRQQAPAESPAEPHAEPPTEPGTESPAEPHAEPPASSRTESGTAPSTPDKPLEKPSVTEEHAVNAGRAWILRHYARLSTAWCQELGIPERAPIAARWFRTKEPLLRTLVTAELRAPERKPEPEPERKPAPEQDPEPEREAERARRERLRLGFEDITRIADALDIWYRREHQGWLAKQLATKLADGARDLDRPTVLRLAELRRNAAARTLPENPSEHGDDKLSDSRRADRKVPRRYRASLRSRLAHGSAMAALGTGNVDDPKLDEVERRLRDAWLWLPRDDLVSAVTILINLSIVHLKQGRLQPARERLELADSLAAAANDAAARARAIELAGVVSWSEGHGSEAMRQWEQARQQYSALGERYGEGRCAQHLGSAVVHDPAMAAVVLLPASSRDGTSDDELGVTRAQADRYAFQTLTRATDQLGEDGALARKQLRKLPAHIPAAPTAVTPPLLEQLLLAAPAGQGTGRHRWTVDSEQPSIEQLVTDFRRVVRRWREILRKS